MEFPNQSPLIKKSSHGQKWPFWGMKVLPIPQQVYSNDGWSWWWWCCEWWKSGRIFGVLLVSNEVDSCSLTGVSIIIELLNGDHEDDCDDHTVYGWICQVRTKCCIIMRRRHDIWSIRKIKWHTQTEGRYTLNMSPTSHTIAKKKNLIFSSPLIKDKNIGWPKVPILGGSALPY